MIKSKEERKNMKSQLTLPQYFPYINETQHIPNESSPKLLKLIRTDSCTNQNNQHLINFPSNIPSRTKTSVMIDNIIVATKEKLQTIKRKESKRKKKQKQKMQYPQNSSSTSSYVRTKSSTPHPKTSLSSINR